MAKLLMEGMAIEIMDGDAVNIPVAWLTQVFTKLDDAAKSTIFKVSALGAQSSGKWTLLNAIFGLNFPVSSGRCTRGAYMQLVRVDADLKETMNCNYLAVIDSEGLMSRMKMGDPYYDNELSTFIIGLSDLTLVIIKGEGSEMYDVLPLAIHVFLKMNIVGEHQACHFVHQNMGAVDAMTKVQTEIDAFVRDLNIKTLAAAKYVDQGEQYTKFTDVLQYDPKTDNTYVPGLWDGAQPMAKTNSHYSKTMQKLKASIIKTVTDIQVNTSKQLFNFLELIQRLDVLWGAIKYENFVFSFRNVLGIEAHRALTNIFDLDQLALKKLIRRMMWEEEKAIRCDSVDNPLIDLIEDSRWRLINTLEKEGEEMRKRIQHYFRCQGCKSCSSTVKNRNLLANNEKEFLDDVTEVKKTLKKEIELYMDKLKVNMETEMWINEMSTGMDDVLKQKVKETISLLTPEELTKEKTEQIFEDLWKDAAKEILQKSKSIEGKKNIEGIVQQTIRGMLKDKDNLYRQRQINKHGEKKTFKVKKKHFKYEINADWPLLQNESDRIVKETSKHYDVHQSPQGKQFSQTDVEKLFQDVLEEINKVQAQLKLTEKYKVDLLYFLEWRSVAGFETLHQKYCNESSPQAILGQKKKSYHDLFMNKMGQGDAAVDFCNTAVRSIILNSIDEQLNPTLLLEDIKEHRGTLFKDVNTVNAFISADLLRDDKFDNYMAYIVSHERFVKSKLNDESRLYFGDRLKKMAMARLDPVIGMVKSAVNEATKSTDPHSHFVRSFFMAIQRQKLEISQHENAAYLELDVPDTKQFSDIIHQQLDGTVRRDLIQTIESLNAAEKLENKDLTEFMFVEIFGCKERCPFCKVPCDAHSGGKTQGNHSAALHRPLGLLGQCDLKTGKLLTNDCCSNVASFSTFTHGENNEKITKFSKYDKVYPDWKIEGKANPDIDKMWKWVFAKYNSEFAKYYHANEADIPEEWKWYKTNEVGQDIDRTYNAPGIWRMVNSVKKFVRTRLAPGMSTGQVEVFVTKL